MGAAGLGATTQPQTQTQTQTQVKKPSWVSTQTPLRYLRYHSRRAIAIATVMAGVISISIWTESEAGTGTGGNHLNP